MSFDWLDRFQQSMEKPADYASKTLAAYKLGMRANGSIAGARVIIDRSGCQACRKLDSATVYHPDKAPILPLEDCDRPNRCGCVYRPVMTYEVEPDDE